MTETNYYIRISKQQFEDIKDQWHRVDMRLTMYEGSDVVNCELREPVKPGDKVYCGIEKCIVLAVRNKGVLDEVKVGSCKGKKWVPAISCERVPDTTEQHIKRYEDQMDCGHLSER